MLLYVIGSQRNVEVIHIAIIAVPTVDTALSGTQYR